MGGDRQAAHGEGGWRRWGKWVGTDKAPMLEVAKIGRMGVKRPAARVGAGEQNGRGQKGRP